MASIKNKKWEVQRHEVLAMKIISLESLQSIL